MPAGRRAPNLQRRASGEEHPATALALSALMVCYAGDGDNGATRDLQGRILRSMERTLGAEDPRVKSARTTYEMLGEARGA